MSRFSIRIIIVLAALAVFIAGGFIFRAASRNPQADYVIVPGRPSGPAVPDRVTAQVQNIVEREIQKDTGVNLPPAVISTPVKPAPVKRPEPVLPALDELGVKAGADDPRAVIAGRHMPDKGIHRIKEIVKSARKEPDRARAELCRILLEDENSIIRSEAAKALSRLSGADTLEALKAGLRDPYPTVVIQSAMSIGHAGGPESTDALVQALRDNRVREDGYNFSIREAVLKGLTAAGDSSCTQAIIDELALHEDPSYDNAAIAALGRVGDARAIDPIQRHLDTLMASQPEEAIALQAWQEAVETAEKALKLIGER